MVSGAAGTCSSLQKLYLIMQEDLMSRDQKAIAVTGRYHQKKSLYCMSTKGIRNGLLIKLFTLIIFLFCCDPLCALEPRNFKFRHLSSKESLSGNSVRAILKDSHGFMWFGTWEGLNRHDGYQFKEYKKQLNNPNSLSNDIITAIHEDKSGKLWLGTIGGLNRFDPATEMFKRYVHNPQDSRSLSNDILVSITEDKNGILWIGTWGGGLIRFDPATERFSSYLHDSQNTSSISGDYVTAVHQARDSRYWVMTRFNGLNLFDPSAQTFRHFPLSEKNEGSDWGQSIIQEDQSGTLWFTSRKALYAINPKTNKLDHYTIKNSDEFRIRGVVAGTRGDLWVYGKGEKHSLYKFDKEKKQFIPYETRERLIVMYGDDSGLIWIGTRRFGIMLFDQYPPKFSHVGYDPTGKKGLPDKQISSLVEDYAGNFWLGTSKSVIHWNRKTGKFTPFQGNPKISASIRKTSRCWNVFADKKGKIWFTSEDYGIDRLDPVTGNLKNYRHIPADKKSLTSDYTIAIISDKDDTIWIGTDKGLNRYDPDLDRFDRFYIDPAKPENPLNNIITIIEDRNGFLWTGSWYGGLSRFDKTKGQFIKSYRYKPNDSNSISSNTVNVIYERQDGRFWVGTSNGISLFDPETEKFKHFTEEDGLPNNYVKGILEDDTKRLWISTNKGLALFNPETKNFRNYDISDGLHSNQFIKGSYTKGSSGEFFFGGMNGFSYFYPERVKDNPYIPPIHITGFQLFNKSVPIGPGSILARAIWSTDRIVLSHKQNIFSLEFASLSYRFPEKNRYRYKLEGLDKNWNEVDSNRRYVTYTHLDPGEYDFRVQGSNNDGVWNEKGASLTIEILPPWWQTWWFRVFSTSISLLIIFSLYRKRVTTLKKQKILLETLVDQRTEELACSNEQLRLSNEAAEAANQAKSTFLANMSHELRTPLNAILGFPRILAQDQDATADQQEKLAIINRSGQHLLSMINDVLDLSKIEAGRVELREDPFDLVALIEEISAMIQSRASEKGISVAVEAETESFPHVKADVGKLRQILINLLSNAVKFTDEGGVTIRCITGPIPEETKRCQIVIEVEDTGLGIDPSIQAKIFDPFVQGIDAPVRKGTGLGLSICKKYAIFLGGTIELESEVGKGSLFRVRLPAEIAKAAEVKPHIDDKPRVIGLAPTQKTWRILVADDNWENLLLLKSVLEEVGFFVLEAKNGKEAVAAFKKESPDFVWMDMRMPAMDGYEAVRQIRQCSDSDTVPIIAITASAFGEQRQEILAAGCNDMVIKPFRAHEIFEMMGRFLDIEYIYEPEEEAAPDREREVELTSSRLADLPEELLHDLREATLALNREAALEVIARIAGQAPEVAADLRELVNNYQMTKLRNRLGEVKANADRS